MVNSNEQMKEWIHKVTGQESHWENLKELEKTPGTREELKSAIMNRFPSTFLSRREFMEWTGALMAVLGLSSCTRQPEEKILPYVSSPEGVVPGEALFFASSFVHDHSAIGILAESHTGRPTKIEGNPSHSANLGGTSVFAQASILELYDPDRLQTPIFKKTAANFQDFMREIRAVLASEITSGGAGIRILTEPILSPTLAIQLKSFFEKYPKAKCIIHNSVERKGQQEGAKLAFGEIVQPVFHLAKARVILSLDANFLEEGPGSLRYAREFSKKKSLGGNGGDAFRFYSFDCTPNITSALADHRWPIRPDLIFPFLATMAREFGIETGQKFVLDASLQKIIQVIVKDLQSNPGASLLVAGEYQPGPVHALVHAINHKLGNAGNTVSYVASSTENSLPTDSLNELIDDLGKEKVKCLAILGGNPVFTASGTNPSLAMNLKKVATSFHLTSYTNETSVHCRWQIPQSHFLEGWGDVRGYDGTVSLVQPLIAPLYSSKTVYEILQVLLSEDITSSYNTIKKTWTQLGEMGWNRAVHDGVIQGTSFPEKRVSLKNFSFASLSQGKGMQIILRPDPTIWDGRYANNPWLQELPKPITKLTWENTMHISPATALQLGVKNGEEIRLKVGQVSVEGPVWIVPGQPKDCVTVHVGYGRKQSGRIGTQLGFDAYPLMEEAGNWHRMQGVSVEKTGKKAALACTQGHFQMEGRNLVRSATAAEFQKNPKVFLSEAEKHAEETVKHHFENAKPETGKPFDDPNYAWGMVIDLNVCNGCNACVVACQAENNIPVVGKDQILREREMHWLRIDRYYSDHTENPDVHFQPVPCMHCETAPCTVVCPVNATSISPEGINEMTYNRCVGTKYCSNNCPYKVRRFNFYQYADLETPVIQLARNPNVTTRGRGIMEKCTYCVQRVNAARVTAKKEDRTVRDGEIVPACAQACPSQAIHFGNIKDPQSKVSQLKASSLNYGLLTELGTRPRTTYLAKISNPNPELGAELIRKSF